MITHKPQPQPVDAVAIARLRAIRQEVAKL